jgi:hypothetical protein
MVSRFPDANADTRQHVYHHSAVDLATVVPQTQTSLSNG